MSERSVMISVGDCSYLIFRDFEATSPPTFDDYSLAIHFAFQSDSSLGHSRKRRTSHTTFRLLVRSYRISPSINPAPPYDNRAAFRDTQGRPITLGQTLHASSTIPNHSPGIHSPWLHHWIRMERVQSPRDCARDVHARRLKGEREA